MNINILKDTIMKKVASTGAMAAVLALSLAAVPGGVLQPGHPNQRRRVPTRRAVSTASTREIAAWNMAVDKVKAEKRHDRNRRALLKAGYKL